MSESSQHSRIAGLIQDIIEACRNDPTRIEVATANFQCLVNAMKLYERAPKYFNAALEEANAVCAPPGQPPIPPPRERRDYEVFKYPVVGDLERIFGKKLKQSQLQEVGTLLAQKTGLRLDRDTKRSKVMLIQWFDQHWAMLHPKIYEYGLMNMPFKR